MDTLVITPNELGIIANILYGDYQIGQNMAINCPHNATVWISSLVSGTREVNNSTSYAYDKIGFGFGGIEWSVTCVIPGGDDPDTPVALSPKTYVDAYGRLHLGDEVEVGMVLTINAKLVSPNPSGSGYEIAAFEPVTITITENETYFGNFNHVERFPYLIYQDGDTRTPASGAGVGEAI